jgi:hypothetical protein
LLVVGAKRPMAFGANRNPSRAGTLGAFLATSGNIKNIYAANKFGAVCFRRCAAVETNRASSEDEFDHHAPGGIGTWIRERRLRVVHLRSTRVAEPH